MLKRFLSPLSDLKRIYKTEDSRFITLVGIKVVAISLGITCFTYYMLFQLMRLNYAFFQSQGMPDLIDQDLFIDYIINEAINTLPVLFIFHIVIFFIGTYVGWLILRPFRKIGEYSEKVLVNANAIYRVDDFSNYKLLTRFAEYFFEHLRESRKKGFIVSNNVPPQYSKIHKPVWDKLFLFHFGILLVIVCTCNAVFIIENTSSIYVSLAELSTQILSDQKVASRFLSNQSFVLDDLVNMSVVLLAAGYVLLTLHLYSKVSGAAFGIFSTMRSFTKGNYSSRVHLVGYAYVREYTRKLNKYLDYIENNFTKPTSKD